MVPQPDAVIKSAPLDFRASNIDVLPRLDKRAHLLAKMVQERAAAAAPLADTALPRGNAEGDAMFFGATRSIAARRSPVRPNRGYRELKDRARGATASARRKRFG